MISKYFNLIPLIFLVLHFTQAQAQPISPGSNTNPTNGTFSPSLGIIIIILVTGLFVVGFFSIYIRCCSDDSSTIYAQGTHNIGLSRQGLDAEVIANFPIFNYEAVKSANIGKGALECAVCLTEFEDDDTLRLIPNCDHVFHPDCIDAWLVGHTTCPVCRCNLYDPSPIEDHHHHSSSSNFVVVVDLDHDVDESNDSESTEMRMTINNNLSFGRSKWWFGDSRSHTTGHVAFKKWEDTERFTLRLPDYIREQIMSGKLERSVSLMVLPRESSSRRWFSEGGWSFITNREGGTAANAMQAESTQLPV